MATITKARPEVEISEAVKKLIQLQPENFTILHCSMNVDEETLIRIWPQTFLIEDSGNKKKLLKAYNISLMPNWTIPVINGNKAKFTLLFEGLSKGCNSFFMLEDIPEQGGFYTADIERNKTDVYSVDVFS